MPETIVRETTVYTLAELEELFPDAYEKAIDQIISQLWDWFEPDDITYDMKENIIAADYPWFELNERKFEWDMGRSHVQGEGDVDLRQFMELHKMHIKYRSLYYAITELNFEKYAIARFGTGYYRHRDHVELNDLRDDVRYYIDNPKRAAKLLEQITVLENEIEAHVGTMYGRLRQCLRDENDYRFSEAFAKEEAEAHEWTFTESGKIYH